MPEITPELAEEIGWHIGDGSMNYYKGKGFYQLRGHIEDDRQHYLNRIKPIFERIYGVKIRLREMSSTRVFGFQIWSEKIVGFKKSLGLPLGKKLELEIPKEFIDREELLTPCIRGLFDTDGGFYLQKKNHKLYPRIYFSTISLKLTEQLTNLLRSIGLRAIKWRDNPPRGNKLASYKVEVKGVEMLHKFMEEIKPQNPKHIAKYNLFESGKGLKII